MKTILMDCPNCGYYLDVKQQDGKFKCIYCGSLLSYNLKKNKLIIEVPHNSIPKKQKNSENNFTILNCPGCGANLEIDKDHLLAYCPYCGKKLFYNMNGLSYVLTEKEKTKRVDAYNNFKLKKIKLEHKEKRKDNLHDTLMIFVPFICMFIIYGIIYIIYKIH